MFGSLIKFPTISKGDGVVNIISNCSLKVISPDGKVYNNIARELVSNKVYNIVSSDKNVHCFLG